MRNSMLRLSDLFPWACLFAAIVGVVMLVRAFHAFTAVEGIDRADQFGDSVAREVSVSDGEIVAGKAEAKTKGDHGQ